MKIKKEYEFPNGRIKVFQDRTCKEFPKWCQAISAIRSRTYVAQALRELRTFRREVIAKG